MTEFSLYKIYLIKIYPIKITQYNIFPLYVFMHCNIILRYHNFTFIACKILFVKVGKTDSLHETIITSGLPGRERKEGGRRRVVECNTGGLKSNRFPWTTPSACTSVLALMKEGYTGDESTWIHRDDDYGSRVGLRRNSPRSESLQRAARIAPINYRR